MPPPSQGPPHTLISTITNIYLMACLHLRRNGGLRLTDIALGIWSHIFLMCECAFFLFKRRLNQTLRQGVFTPHSLSTKCCWTLPGNPICESCGPTPLGRQSKLASALKKKKNKQKVISCSFCGGFKTSQILLC